MKSCQKILLEYYYYYYSINIIRIQSASDCLMCLRFKFDMLKYPEEDYMTLNTVRNDSKNGLMTVEK